MKKLNKWIALFLVGAGIRVIIGLSTIGLTYVTGNLGNFLTNIVVEGAIVLGATAIAHQISK